jgi:hypothetical protein
MAFHKTKTEKKSTKNSSEPSNLPHGLAGFRAGGGCDEQIVNLNKSVPKSDLTIDKVYSLNILKGLLTKLQTNMADPS